MINDYKNQIIFKLFNLPLNAQSQAIEQFTAISGGKVNLIFEPTADLLDLRAKIELNGGDAQMLDKMLKLFINTFSSFIYADYETSLKENVILLAKLYSKKISVAESFTGGKICSTLVSVAGASEVLYEGFTCYNTQSKIQRLNVSPLTVKTHTVVSKEVAYEMVKGLLEVSPCDFAVCTTGYASPTGEEDKPCGLCFVGVGCEDKIEVVKYNFTGDRQTIMQLGTNCALFALNKILKQNTGLKGKLD